MAGRRHSRGQPLVDEYIAECLPGYRGMGPVRVSNQAHEQIQNDVYGEVILAAAPLFFDRRLPQRGGKLLFAMLEIMGEHAASLFDKPDAGLWELRGKMRVHTFSSVVCWAGCDRLSRIATQLGISDRAEYWRAHADHIHAVICDRSWNPARESFMGTMEGDTLDASLLLLSDLGFLAADDPRFSKTVIAIEGDLRRGNFVFRYSERDDFGTPENAFTVCCNSPVGRLAPLIHCG